MLTPHLGYGTLEFFNYDTSTSSGSVFGVGQNKIEAGVGVGSPNEVVSKIVIQDQTSDYPIEKSSNRGIIIDGQPAIKNIVELIGGQKYVTYYILIRHLPNVSLGITIYGDPANSPILDQVVKSIRFSK